MPKNSLHPLMELGLGDLSLPSMWREISMDNLSIHLRRKSLGQMLKIGKEIGRNGRKRVDGISENLVKQPSFRTIQGNISNGCQQLLNRSLVGSTKGSVQPDMLHAKILDRGFTFLTIRGLADKKFLISFISDDDKELDISGNSDLFLDIKVVEDCDLIVPRTTWILSDGLPLSVWNKETWELILAD